MEYKAIYKCRLCGEIFEDGRTRDEDVASACVCAIAVNGSTQYVRYNSKNLYRHNIHYCKDGSVGFADFQGFKKLNEDLNE